MNRMQLENLSTVELAELNERLDELIAQKRVEERFNLRARLEQMAEQAGLSLDEIAGGKGASARKGRGRASRNLPVTARFANPHDPRLTWSGRGRKPNWLVAALEDGADLEDFRL